MQYHPFLPEVASGTIDPRAGGRPAPARAPSLRGRDRRGGTRRPRRADRARPPPRRPAGVARLRRGRTRARLVGTRAPHPRPGRARGRVQDGPGGHLAAQPGAVAARRRRGQRRRGTAAGSAHVRVRRRGYAGVEALGELEDLARDALDSYPGLRPDQMRWVLVEAAGSILPEIGAGLAATRSSACGSAGSRSCWTRGSTPRREGVLRLSDGQAFPRRDARVDRGRQAVTPRGRVRLPGRRGGPDPDRHVPARRGRRGRVGGRRLGGGARSPRRGD